MTWLLSGGRCLVVFCHLAFLSLISLIFRSVHLLLQSITFTGNYFTVGIHFLNVFPT